MKALDEDAKRASTICRILLFIYRYFNILLKTGGFMLSQPPSAQA
jgi:hypothetical protein